MNEPPNTHDQTEGLPPDLETLESRLAAMRSSRTGTPLPDVVRRRVRGSRWSRRIRLGGASALAVILVGLGPSLIGSLTGPTGPASEPKGVGITLVSLPLGDPPRIDPGLSRLTVALGRDPALLWSILDGVSGAPAGDGFSDPARGADDPREWTEPTQPGSTLPPT
ncbi:MAG: hypothetical protein AAGG07_09940 [Planctomycetota bacterium]